MIFKPSELKVVPLSEVPPGSLATLIGRESDIPLFLSLSGVDGKARIMFLGGDYSFEVALWSIEDATAFVVCAADELRVKLGSADASPDERAPGSIALTTSGAFIRSKPTKQIHHGAKIDLNTWDKAEGNLTHDQFLMFSDWEFGKLDDEGKFATIFAK